jgi:hypothetical protein
MSATTRNLHEAIDAHAKRTGVPYLHPDEPTVQLDLLGSKQVIEWQEGKAAFLFASEAAGRSCGALRPLRHNATAQLIAKLKTLEHASGSVSLRFRNAGDGARLRCADGTRRPRDPDAAGLQQDAQLPRVDGRARRRLRHRSSTMATWRHSARRSRPETRFVFAETFTNPLVRAQDFDALRTVIDRGRSLAPALRLVLDTTIASPWAFNVPPLQNGVDIIVASGTKSLGGNDRDMWGYIATNDTRFANR